MIDTRIGLFVDTISLHKNIKRIYQGKLDYRKYLNRVEKEGSIYRAFAYGTQIQDKAEKFIDFLKLIGFETKYIEPKRNKIYPFQLLETLERVFELEVDDPILVQLEKKIKDENIPYISYDLQQTDINIEMIMDILKLVERLDTIVLGTSNIKMLPLVRFLREKGLKVIIFSCAIPREMKSEASHWWSIDKSYLEERKPEEKRMESIKD